MTEPLLIDVCGLEPPEPMERVMDALGRLNQGQELVMLIDREPKPLFRILERNGFSFRIKQRSDFNYEITIWHKH